VENIN